MLHGFEPFFFPEEHEQEHEHEHHGGGHHHHHHPEPGTDPAVLPAASSNGGKIGRNDPCPCGSGKKYKKCHGA
ncbi:MAG TPA: zinc chelation protein SecC [Solibacterales bacterium]|nr:zinc chelation protein SecC [Bryobacterales bacterium]